MSKAAFGFLWCFILVLPWDAFSLPLVGSIPRLVGLVASTVGILHILARWRVRPLTWFHVFAALFVLWAGLSSFWSIDLDTTRTRFLTYLQLVVLVWLIWEIAWSPERKRALLQAYVLGACVTAGATISNYLTGVSLDAEAARFTALNSDPNELGLSLALGLPMAWYLGLSARRRRTAWVWQLYLPLGITATLLTGSRGAFVAALVALMIIPWSLGRVRLRTKAILSTLVVGSLLLASNVVPPTSLERIRSTRADIESGYFGGRGAIWLAGLEVAREHPVIGVGAGAFEAAVASVLPGRWSSHQVLLAILVEQGLVGLGLFLAMVLAALQPLRGLLPLQRRLWLVLLATLTVGSLSLQVGYRKQFWFVLGMLAAQVASPSLSSLASRRRLRGVGGEGAMAATNP